MTSGYLLTPLRSLEEALRDIERRRQGSLTAVQTNGVPAAADPQDAADSKQCEQGVSEKASAPRIDQDEA